MGTAVLTTCFWAAVVLVGYAYAGYPAILSVCARLLRRPVRRHAVRPMVSFIITAHNEQTRIRAKLENTRTLDYPPDRLEILVASDCSTDATDAIVRSFAPHGVQLVACAERRGKEAAQQQALAVASGEVLVFSDVGTILDRDALSRIVANFADPTVGCVSSVDRLLDADGSVSGESAYVRYEMWLRQLESSVNTLVGLSGSFFAARRAVVTPWRPDLQSDFNTLLNSVRKGLRGVSDPDSIGYYRNIASERGEFHRKVRTVVRGIAVFMNAVPLLNPFRYGVFAWQLFSHKLCRWLVPWALLTALVCNLLLLPAGRGWTVILVGQLLFYGFGVWGALRAEPPAWMLLKIPYYFVSVNAAILTAWLRYFRGERWVTWQPSQR